MRWLIYTLAGVLLTDAEANEYITAPTAGLISPPAQEWISTIESLAPAVPTVDVSEPRKLLVFSLATGFQHEVTPHVSEMISVLGKKSGAFTAEGSDDVQSFTEKNE